MKPLSQKAIECFGKLRPQEVILGLFGEYVDLPERVWSGGLVRLMEDLGFNGPAARVALNRVIARGLLAPTKAGRFVFYTITERLAKIHKEGRQRTFSPPREIAWTGQWTLVWYAIPEDQRLQRARLGRWLGLRAFGLLQDGTWIAPGDDREDVVALAKWLGVNDFVLIVVGSIGEVPQQLPLIYQVWKIDELKEKYELFTREYEPYLRGDAWRRLEPREAFIIRTQMIDMFRQLMVQDPRIPDDILSIEWSRRDAIDLFLALQEHLLAAATDYFRGHAILAPG